MPEEALEEFCALVFSQLLKRATNKPHENNKCSGWANEGISKFAITTPNVISLKTQTMIKGVLSKGMPDLLNWK